jgi:hypothetical protein
MSKNAIRNLITALFCGAEGIHFLIPQVPLGISTSLGLLVRAIMDQMYPAVAANDPTSPTVAPVVPPVVKVGLFLLVMLACSPSFAVPLTAVAPTNVGEDDIILAPIGAIEFNPSTKDNYGLAISESISFAQLLPGPDSNHVVVSPYAFFGVFCAANIGQWVATNAHADVQFDYGLMVGLPKLDVSIPEVAFSYNFRDSAFLINVAFPADILPAILVHKL